MGTSTLVSTDQTFPTVLSDPASSSMKTLVLLYCLVTGGFMAELIQSASDRENASGSLDRVVVIDQSNKHLPT